MSFLVMRPPAPLPWPSRARSIPFSLAIRRTSGEVRMRRAGLAGACGAAGVLAGGAEAGGAAGSGLGAAPEGALRWPTCEPSPMKATTVLISTVSPSGKKIASSTPASGAGTSESTLSVEISKRASSRSTLSPGPLSHLVMVPSTMLSPIWGMTTSPISVVPRSQLPACNLRARLPPGSWSGRRRRRNWRSGRRSPLPAPAPGPAPPAGT